MKKLKTAKDILDKKYGAKGTESRRKFSEEAHTWYFSEIIKNRRKELNLSQEELALKIGKHRPYVSRIEKGEDIAISDLLQLSHALDLKVELIEK